MEIDGDAVHYIDEGQGETILFLHGTPEWSFGYRDLIKTLRNKYRCVAPDMLGFGLSDKPAKADYTCKTHASRLEKLISKLDLKNFSIVANDFGGSISLSYAIKRPDNIRRIILFNTWMRSLKEDKHYSTPAKIMNTWFGKWLYLNGNFPVNVIMPAAYGNKKLLTKEVHSHYKLALQKNERTASYAFAKELMNASDWWEQLWKKVTALRHIPFLFFWGLKDNFVPPAELEKWKSKLPHAKIVSFGDAGHFVQEEKPEEMATVIQQFLREG